ncbi:MAG: sulfatase [Alphaproteobacteria bacterium]|nr:sulfatase [Alphaproteobacteria bacterium]
MSSRVVNFVNAALGGVIGGAVLGLVESLFLLVTQGAPDLLSPVYALVLYGLIGLPFGIAAGFAMLGVARVREWGDTEPHLATTMGATFAVSPMLLFILFYLGNKVVYHEQGVPTTGKLAILVIVAGYALLELTAGTMANKRLGLTALHSAGAWVALVLFFGAVSAIPMGDPRSGWAHGKSVPGGMADNPNVLIIAVDTLRADYLGTYGKEGNPTPVIDALASDGVVFENASAHASWTRSSFASLWSSRIPSSHNADTKASRMSNDLVLLSEALHDAGVTTANLANNINVTATFNFDQGYDTFIYEAPHYHFGATESVFGLTFYKVVHKLREKLGGSKEVGTFYQPAEVVLDDAKGFIQANREGRWMLGVHLMEPHDPYFEHPYLMGQGDAEFNGVGFARAEVESPKLDQAEYLKKVYFDEIKHMDKKLAPFVAWLKSEGLYDDTLIVLTADHGEEFGEHGGFWHGTTLYEEQIHVPLVVKLPKNAHAGARVGWQARLVDVAPTIATAMGVQVKDEWGWMGSDLVAQVQLDAEIAELEKRELDDARKTVDELSEQRDAGLLGADQLDELAKAEARIAKDEADPDPCALYAVKGDRTVYAEQDFEGNVLSALKAGGFKLIVANADNPRGLPETELFDVRADPHEKANLAAVGSPVCGQAPSARVPEMKQKLEDDLATAASGAPIVEQEAEMSQAEVCQLCALGYMSGPACDEC